MFIEISQREQKKESEASDGFLRIAGTLGCPVFGLDTDGRLDAWNPYMVRLTGYDASEVLGRDLGGLFSSSSRQRIREAVKAALAGRDTPNIEIELQNKEGEVVHLLASIESRLDSSSKKVLGAACIAQDITRLKQDGMRLQGLIEERDRDLTEAHQQAEESRHTRDVILSRIEDSVVAFNSEGRVSLLNTAAERLFHISREDVIGSRIDAANLPPRLNEIVQEVSRSSETVDESIEFKDSKNGSRRTLAVRAVALEEPQGTAGGLVVLIRDLTQLEQLERMKSEFLSTASHELRAPLSTIVGFSEILLLREKLSADRRKHYLELIHQASQHLALLIDDLLDLSKIDAGRGIDLRLGETRLADILGGAVDAAQERYRDHRIRLELSSLAPVVQCDSERITKVVFHLIDNAVSYSPGGDIVVALTEEPNTVSISVSDQGIGMTDEQVSRAFDRFYRGDSSDTAVEGTGLGLSFAKEVVEAHGGEIFIESRLGTGSEVTFRLPRHPRKA